MINFKDVNWELAGKGPGEKCNTPSCRGKATHVTGTLWYCYYCAVKINARARAKVCISGKEHVFQLLRGE